MIKDLAFVSEASLQERTRDTELCCFYLSLLELHKKLTRIQINSLYAKENTGKAEI